MSPTLDTITPMPEGGNNQTSVNISKEDLKVETEHYENVAYIASTHDGLIVSTQSSRRRCMKLHPIDASRTRTSFEPRTRTR